MSNSLTGNSNNSWVTSIPSTTANVPAGGTLNTSGIGTAAGIGPAQPLTTGLGINSGSNSAYPSYSWNAFEEARQKRKKREIVTNPIDILVRAQRLGNTNLYSIQYDKQFGRNRVAVSGAMRYLFFEINSNEREIYIPGLLRKFDSILEFEKMRKSKATQTFTVTLKLVPAQFSNNEEYKVAIVTDRALRSFFSKKIDKFHEKQHFLYGIQDTSLHEQMLKLTEIFTRQRLQSRKEFTPFLKKINHVSTMKARQRNAARQALIQNQGLQTNTGTSTSTGGFSGPIYTTTATIQPNSTSYHTLTGIAIISSPTPWSFQPPISELKEMYAEIYKHQILSKPEYYETVKGLSREVADIATSL